MALVGLKHGVVLFVFLASATPVFGQYQFGLGNFSENQPGRIYYDCYNRLNSYDSMWKAIAEDGSSIGYGMLRTMSAEEMVVPETRLAIDKRPSISVEIVWPAQLSTKRTRSAEFNQDDASLSVRFMSRDESTLDRKKFPWSQYVVGRNENFYLHEVDGVRSMILPVAAPVLMTEPMSNDATYRFFAPLSDIAAWADANGEVTVYKLYIAKREKRAGEIGYVPFGQRRIAYSYRLRIGAIVGDARKAGNAFKEWEKSLTDFKVRCTRTEEEDESQIIVT
jgi:hypothetical protein